MSLFAFVGETVIDIEFYCESLSLEWMEPRRSRFTYDCGVLSIREIVRLLLGEFDDSALAGVSKL